MKNNKFFFTSESVSEGHPDKVCDRISDMVVDTYLSKNPVSRVACETLVTTWTVVVSWEITTKANLNYTDIVRKTINDIWYNEPEACFMWDEVWVHLLINTQSPDIAQWVNTGWARDQWIMFGYATNETENYLPLSIS